MGKKTSFINILFGTLWNWVIGGIMNILGVIQLFADISFIDRVLWYGWVIIGIIIWIIGIAFNYHKSIKESEHFQSANKDINEIKNKPNRCTNKERQKTLKRVFAHVEFDKKGIYVIIENKEFKIDVICSEIIIREVIPLEKSNIFFILDAQNNLNSITSTTAVLAKSLLGIDDAIFIRHRRKKEVVLFAVESSKNQLEFKPPNNSREPLTKGYYGIEFNFVVYPQENKYSPYHVYKRILIDYRGRSNLKLWESEMSKQEDDKKLKKYTSVKARSINNNKKEAFTKEDFFKALDKAILTIKKPKSPDEGKKKTSG